MSGLQKTLGGLTLAMLAGVALLLAHLKAHQRLGEPGIKTEAIEGRINRRLLLPEQVPGYTCETLTNIESALETFFPSDTSFKVLAYHGDDGFFCEYSVVLMGLDRSSIHNPDICMPSQGWDIDGALTSVQTIQMTAPVPYTLSVNRLISSKEVKDDSGKSQVLRGIYVYWYVDASHYTEKAWEWRAWYIPRDLVFHGQLDRWAYISLFSSCLPGQEDATFERMKKLISLTVPQFQTVPQVPPGQ